MITHFLLILLHLPLNLCHSCTLDSAQSSRPSWEKSAGKFLTAIESLEDVFPNQKKEIWSQLKSKISTSLEMQAPQQPTVITILLPPKVDNKFATCFIASITSAVNNGLSSAFSMWTHPLSLNLSLHSLEQWSTREAEDLLNSFLKNHGKVVTLWDADKYSSQNELFWLSQHFINDKVDPRATYSIPVNLPLRLVNKIASNQQDFQNVFKNMWTPSTNPDATRFMSRLSDTIIMLEEGDKCNENLMSSKSFVTLEEYREKFAKCTKTDTEPNNWFISKYSENRIMDIVSHRMDEIKRDISDTGIPVHMINSLNFEELETGLTNQLLRSLGSESVGSPGPSESTTTGDTTELRGQIHELVHDVQHLKNKLSSAHEAKQDNVDDKRKDLLALIKNVNEKTPTFNEDVGLNMLQSVLNVRYEILELYRCSEGRENGPQSDAMKEINKINEKVEALSKHLEKLSEAKDKGGDDYMSTINKALQTVKTISDIMKGVKDAGLLDKMGGYFGFPTM